MNFSGFNNIQNIDRLKGKRSATVFAQKSKKGKANKKIQVCTNITCRKQGQQEVYLGLKGLAIPEIDIEETGCLAECGDGPNVCCQPSGNKYKGVRTNKAILQILKLEYDIDIHPIAVQVLKLKRKGNQALQKHEFDQAIDYYTQALELQPPTMHHILFANRSSACLLNNQIDQAYEDAQSSIKCSPPGYVGGQIRLSEVKEKQREYDAALNALRQACNENAEYCSTVQYRVKERLIKQKLK